MRRALLQILPATSSCTSWFSMCGASASQLGVLRSAGETSTSYGPGAEGPLVPALVRGFAKPAAKGKGQPQAAPAAPPPPKPAAATSENVLASAGSRLRRRQPDPDPLTLLTPEQRQLAELLAQRPSPPPDAAAADDASAAAAADTVAAAAAAAAEPAELRGLGQLGLPLSAADVSSLLQQSLSEAVGQNVQFQPIVFSNIFQSAAAAATYVAAALEGGANWGRVERFFLAAVEADTIVRGVRVAVSGRLGVKADMAATKVWEWGEMSLRPLSDRLDYGMATANTRLGALGVKVWIRYKTAAIKDVFFPPMGGSHYRAAPAAGASPTMSLDDLYKAATARTTRLDLPYKFSSVGWWERAASEQPAENRVGMADLFVQGYSPAAGDRLDHYLRQRAEERRRFRSAAERTAYMATTGRFLAKQRHLAKLRAGEVRAQLGRRARRVLARYPVEMLGRQRLTAVVLRYRAKTGKGAVTLEPAAA